MFKQNKSAPQHETDSLTEGTAWKYSYEVNIATLLGCEPLLSPRSWLAANILVIPFAVCPQAFGACFGRQNGRCRRYV
jgi:hypothetical protein